MSETLTPEQQATYARYYVMLRACACAGPDDPRSEKALEAAMAAFDVDDGRPDPELFDSVMGAMAQQLGF